MTTENVTILFTAAADEVEPGDQIIADGELFIVRAVDNDRDDIDEIRFVGENLTDPANDTLDVCFNEEFEVWAL